MTMLTPRGQVVHLRDGAGTGWIFVLRSHLLKSRSPRCLWKNNGRPAVAFSIQAAACRWMNRAAPARRFSASWQYPDSSSMPR